MNSNDPFLSHRAAPPQSGSPAQHSFQSKGRVPKPRARNGKDRTGVVIMTVIPFTLFLVTITCYSTFYFQSPGPVHVATCSAAALFVLLTMIFALDAFPTRSNAHRTWYIGFMLNCFFGVVAGIGIGIYVYHSSFFYWWSMKAGSAYNHVDASKNSNVYIDASVLTFTEMSTIQVSKSIGFAADNIYCVAPVQDALDMSTATYWAVGQNCCGARGEFTCDSAHDGDAHNGVVVPHQELAFFSYAEEMYHKAIIQAAAVYGLDVPKDPVLLRWVKDVDGTRTSYFWQGQTSFITFGIVLFVMHLVISALVYSAVRVAAHNSKRDGPMSSSPYDHMLP